MQNQNQRKFTWTDGSEGKLLLFLFHTQAFGWLGQSVGGAREDISEVKHSSSVVLLMMAAWNQIGDLG